VRRLNRLAEVGDSIDNMSPSQLIQEGLCDPVKLFIKKEPHNLKKIVTGKLRIIASVSLVDQIVTRVLCMKQNKAEIKEWKMCPSAPGMGLNDDSLCVIWETAEIMGQHGTVCETDVSGWDWSMKPWELEEDAKLRALLAGEEPGSLFGRLLRSHAHIVCNSVFVIGDGEMLAQTIPGGQLSGDYNTSSTNSRGRAIASLAARWKAQVFRPMPLMGIKCMGDDSFEIFFQGLVEGLEAIGHTIKMCVQRPNLKNFEFCSQKFLGRGRAYPVTATKTLFRFLSHNPADPKYAEYRAQLMDYFRHLPEDQLEPIRRLANARVARAQKLADSVEAN
jgi:hypothetical protein